MWNTNPQFSHLFSEIIVFEFIKFIGWGWDATNISTGSSFPAICLWSERCSSICSPVQAIRPVSRGLWRCGSSLRHSDIQGLDHGCCHHRLSRASGASWCCLLHSLRKKERTFGQQNFLWNKVGELVHCWAPYEEPWNIISKTVGSLIFITQSNIQFM